ncbi:MAG: polyphosphate kinase 1 [Flavobacteriales bacterium]|jgi:polyphosphate kinase
MNLINRELSWLSFNERVLQEALDPNVPLVERMRFLGIYSNNMDEFYRVRVANLRRMIAVKKRHVDGFSGSPTELYSEIRRVVMKQQDKFELAYQKIVNELALKNIFHLDESSVSDRQYAELKTYFNKELKHAITPVMLDKKTPFPRLKDSGIYLAIRMVSENNRRVKFAMIQIPQEFPRFYRIKEKETENVILIDDIIRLNLKNIFSIFPFDSIEAYTFKFTRDAELDLDDDISVSFLEKIEKSLKQRKKGHPVRFVYDEKMPKDLMDHLLSALNLKFGVNTIPGGKYHNFKDFISFPSFETSDFLYQPQPPKTHSDLEGKRSLIKSILEKDIILHFPYQKFDYVVDLLREAAIDPKVTSIKINVYRVARNSQVMNALMAAVYNGKNVTVVLELRARFDEENNVEWATILKENGAKVVYGIPEFKVHSKLLQIARVENRQEQLITYVGTGNFNERSALIYSDLALLTADSSISKEVKKVFRLLENNLERGIFKELLVSPFNTRRKIVSMIDGEIKNAKKKLPSSIRVKLNNLTDKKMIEKLYEASRAGVKIEMIIRGICCLIPGVKGLSENITVISIVDRYLEHSRFMIFHNNGKPIYYLTSADWMERNLDNRIEVGVPLKNEIVQREIDTIFDYQWRGSVKSRLIRKDLKNLYRKLSGQPFHAQVRLYEHYAELADAIISHK